MLVRLIYVSDTDNHRVSAFTFDGQFMRSFSDDDDELSCPLGLAYDARHNTLYVVDSGHNCIKARVSQSERAMGRGGAEEGR